jgi:chromosomal replication initiator protein
MNNPLNSFLPALCDHVMNDEHCLAFWQKVLTTLEQEISIQQFKTWIAPLRCFGLDTHTNKILIVAPNRFKLDFVKKQFASIIYSIAQQFWEGIDLDFSLYNPKAMHTHSAFQNHSDEIQTASLPQAIKITAIKSVAKQAIQSTQHENEYQRDIFDELATKHAHLIMPINNHAHINNNVNKNENVNLDNYQISATNELNTIKTSKSRSNSSSGLSYEQTRLNKILNFDTFIEGQANMLARSAAIQVATSSHRTYNPCYFYGGVGLGKTHLMHAIGNNFYKTHKAKVRYIHAEQFVSDVVKAYQRKNYDELKTIYHSLDLLLIDDIQFLAGKVKTQEEFYHVFESLLNRQAQIIITSDIYPRELKDIDDKLVSRFNSGLVVAIEPPEIDMRIKILLNKAKQDKFKLSEDVAFFVAKNLASNIRELEGALRKLMAYHMFHKVNIDVDVAKIALKDILPDIINTPTINIEYIQKIVAVFYGIHLNDMSSRKRTANLTKPRHIAMYFAKELTTRSLPEIGALFGGRDHSTILHAVKKIKKDMELIPELAHDIHTIRQSFNQTK